MSWALYCNSLSCCYLSHILLPPTVPSTLERRPRPAIGISVSASVALSNEDSLSARERRKQRNERREQLQAGKTPWRDEVENKVMEKKKPPPKGLKHQLDMSRLTAKGLQWWIVFVPSRSEDEMAENIAEAYSKSFPDNEFEVFIPRVPSKRRMKDGSFSASKQKLHSGCVFVRTVMTRQVYNLIRKVPRCRGFYGSKVGFLEQFVMPTPVATADMDAMFKKIKEEEDDLSKLKEQARLDRKATGAVEHTTEENHLFTVGSTIKVNRGPYANFEGYIIKLPNEDGKVRASLVVFGNSIEVELNLEDIEFNQTRDSSLKLQLNER